MSRGQRTEDRGWILVRQAARCIFKTLFGSHERSTMENSAAQPHKTLSSVLSPQSSESGFTLIEAIIVITITATIAAVVAVFIKTPIQGYFDSSHRAELTDIADTALRRISRDLRLALPNSVRVTTSGNIYYLEFLETSAGGRYRADTGTGANDLACNTPLDFTTTSSGFCVLGPPVNVNTGLVAVYNLGVPGANAYNGDNTSAITGVSANHISINAMLFPFASPSNRFQIISTPVSYVCDPTVGTLTRYWNYPITLSQPTSFTGASSALLATHVSACTFSYTQQVVTQQAGLVATSLQITENNETVSLYEETHVSNAP
ncbi:MAG: prepilin-type N-terminal cleavage/methylation domain-containing protein [Sulfuriferula sp.]